MWRGRHDRVPEVQSARRIELVDASGRVRAVLGNLSDSASAWFPGLALLDEDGHERLSLMLGATGPLLSFAEAGNVAVELGVHDRANPETLTPGPFLVLCDRTGAVRWSIHIDPDGHPSIVGDDETEDE
jgi:hypothetical protein